MAEIYHAVMQKHYYYITSLLLILFFTPYALAQQASTATTHFVGDNGKQWFEYEPIWNKLQKFYGNAMPPQITIKFTNAKGVSRFNPKKNWILIDRQSYQKEGVRVIAHEASHLCLNLLTNGASNREQFRFMDEGFAEIISRRIAGNLDQYKLDQVLPTAALQLQKGNLSFAKVQKWSEYFGGPYMDRWYAYAVGASFDFFIIDQFGEEKLKELFIAIGSSRDFTTAVHKALGKTLDVLEADWKAYLTKIPLSFAEPQITKFFPLNNALDVPTDLSEIFISFSVPMVTNIRVIANCDEGICYTNAYWKDRKKLAIRLPKQLLANHKYTVRLGHDGQMLKSQSGIPLPITIWKFTTKREKTAEARSQAEL